MVHARKDGGVEKVENNMQAGWGRRGGQCREEDVRYYGCLWGCLRGGCDAAREQVY